MGLGASLVNRSVYSSTTSGGWVMKPICVSSQAAPPGVLRFRSTQKRTTSALMGDPSSKNASSRTLMV